jgi:DDE superfamily endonuclease/Helix-turn-helix of DDE superfamily endonuclease
VYSTTGLENSEIIDVCAMICAEVNAGDRKWPPRLGLYLSVVIALTYMRRNRVQAEIAETYGVSQATVSRAVSAITPLLGKILKDFVPTADDLDEREQYIADGTLLPCWSWAGHPELYSGKHKATGMNVQVACTLSGNIAWISDALPGSRHDSWCLSESGALAGFPPCSWIGDKAYIGKGMITPVRKPADRDLMDWEKEFSTAVNKIRYVIERVIANFKTWRIMHTDYRRPLATFTATISAVIALHFYATA